MNTQDYYPHMIVGNVEKIPIQTITDFFITYGLDNSTLINELIAADRTLDAYKAIVINKKETDDIIDNKAEVMALFSKFDFYLEMFTTDDETSIVAPSSSDFDFVNHESKLWDSLIVYFIDNTKPDFYQTLVYGLKMISLFKKIEDGSFDTNIKILDYWKKSKIILPTSLFPLPKANAETLPEIPTEDSSPTVEELQDELKKLSDARNEILLSYDVQTQSLKNERLTETEYRSYITDTFGKDGLANENPPTIDIDIAYHNYSSALKPQELIEEQYSQISDEIITTIATLGIPTATIDVAFVLEKIDKKCTQINNSISELSSFDRIVQIGDVLISVENALIDNSICISEAKLSHCSLLHQLNAKNTKDTYVQVLGIGYANIIRQTLKKYEATEIAHIENVMAGETKEKTHRNLKIKEEYYSSETEKSEETETDTKTTDRFELSKEINKISSTADQFNAGLMLSGSYGTVSFGANLGYASQNASSEASSTSVSNSKEITKSAVNRIQERILEKRSVTNINEVEVTNLHSIKNDADGAKHISGIYYWVDKVYENQVYNLGKRLMLEFLVPEPAAYIIYSEAYSKNEGKSFIKPKHPSEYSNIVGGELKSHKNISRENYGLWAALYNAQDVVPTPSEFNTISKAYSQESIINKDFLNKDYNDLKIKDGYVAKTAELRIAMSSGVDSQNKIHYIHGFIGNKFFTTTHTNAFINGTGSFSLNDETELVPLSFRGYFGEFSMNVEVICKLSDNGLEKWQLQTYNSIMNAYQNQKDEYDYKIESLEAGINISGQNPILNRKSEKTELKKWGIEMLTLQRFDSFNAMKRAKNGHPEIDFEKALEESKFIKFFEQSIEWNNMTYLLYPYFWSPKPNWTVIKQLNDTDPKYTDFLQAGYARVVVPVHPKFTEAILHYLNTGDIWLGEDLPAINDELYLSIIDEIKEAENNTNGIPQGDKWETHLPTNMVMLSDVIPADLPGSSV